MLKSRVESPESPRLPSANPAKLSPTLPYAMLRKPEDTSLPSRSRRGRCRARSVASLNCHSDSPAQAMKPAHMTAGPHGLAASCSMAPVGSAWPGAPKTSATAIAPMTTCSSAITAKPERATTSSAALSEAASAASAAANGRPGSPAVLP